MTDKSAKKEVSPAKLLIGVAGIYGAFMYYGLLQAEVVKFKSPSGEKLEREWFVQSMEAFCGVIVGGLGLFILQGGPSPYIPYSQFALSGTTQVLAKAMTQKAMIYGVPFFVATLVKNAKMVPVMIGAIVLSGKSYSTRKYLQVALIIGGVLLVNLGKAAKPPTSCKADKDCKKGFGCDSGKGECVELGSDSESLGLLCLGLSLLCDGLTGGTQDAMKEGYAQTTLLKTGTKQKLQPYDYMFFTNIAMLLIAVGTALGLDQFHGGVAFVLGNSEVAVKLAKFCACSALGQSAIFFTLANFDPLLCTTVTTTRKIFSVLLDIATQGHVLTGVQWGGVGVASLGVAFELEEKFGGSKKNVKAKE